MYSILTFLKEVNPINKYSLILKRYKLFSPESAAAKRNNSVRNHHYYTKKQQRTQQKQQQKTSSSPSVAHQHQLSSESKKSTAVLSQNSVHSKSISRPISVAEQQQQASPSVSFMITGNNKNNYNHSSSNPRNQSIAGFDSDLNSEAAAGNHKSSFSVIGLNASTNSRIMNSTWFGQTHTLYKYEKEFQELQFILIWFPEEVALRLTDVEYELFRQIPPIEYLRHATLDMNKTVQADNMPYRQSTAKLVTSDKEEQQQTTATTASESKEKTATNSTTTTTKTVHDLIVRYKEVSSWIKRLIQSQPTSDKRLAIILSAIRCAITCWNIGNFNSSREIWLGLK